MHDIKTLVYFDLEATGLRNSGKPRITELSLVAVNLLDVLGRKFYRFSLTCYFKLPIFVFQSCITVLPNSKRLMLETILDRVWKVYSLV